MADPYTETDECQTYPCPDPTCPCNDDNEAESAATDSGEDCTMSSNGEGGGGTGGPGGGGSGGGGRGSGGGAQGGGRGGMGSAPRGGPAPVASPGSGLGGSAGGGGIGSNSPGDMSDICDLPYADCLPSLQSQSVLLTAGRFSFKQRLLSVDSIGGISWAFNLSYLGNNGVDGLLGKNFNYPQNLRLEEQVSGDVDLLSGKNTSETFNKTGPSTYEPAADNNTQSVLTRAGSGATDEFTLTSASGTVSKFFGFDSPIPTPGRVKSITDRYGNQQTYTWVNVGGQDQVQTIADSYGRSVTYSYYGSEKDYRLQEVEDFLGRKLNFQYDDDGHLVAVVLPSILQAAEGNTFPGGTAFVFEYDVNNPRPERQDDLIRVWYPNQTLSFIDTETRTVDVEQVYADAIPRYVVEYGQDPTDADFWGKVTRETVGDPDNGVGGTYTYLYTTENLPTNIIDPSDPIVQRTVVTDRNGNQRVYDFNANEMPVRVEVLSTRTKNSLEASSFVTWTKYSAHNQPLVIVYPEGNSVEYEYEDGTVTGISGTYNKRVGLRLKETHLPGNSIGIPSRSGSNGQTELTRRYFYDPIYSRRCAMIERRGNPIAASSTYFTPQNGGTTPTDADRSRYATITYYDYQKDTSTTVKNDSDLQALLGLTATQIQALIDHVDGQMTTEGLSAGFEMGLGDINGDGTGDGTGIDAPHLGNVVKVKHPSVRLIGSTSITTQLREDLYTTNARGQTTTHTDPEGNLTVYVRYPFADPEGDGKFVSPGLGNKQYGRLKEIHVDADPNEVMSLIGEDGDLVDFIPYDEIPYNVTNSLTRTNTPGIYQDLVTRHEGASGEGGGCTSCAYDPLGNPLAVTDPRGFTTRFERNEMGMVYRTTSPEPYNFRVETYYDANRNVTRVDTEDMVVAYDSEDPTSADYGHFTPTGSGSTAHVPMKPGPGGAVRSGWFTNLFTYDLLDNQIEVDVDATGSSPSSLVLTMEYDANQNLIKTTKPEGNTVEYDYDERNLRIAERIGYDPDNSDPGSVTVYVYDGNKNLTQVIGPAARGGSGNHQTVVIADAFQSAQSLAHTGDWLVENTYDGFDRVIQTTDSVGNVSLYSHDPNNRVIQSTQQGPVGGATPTNRNGTSNVDLAQSITRFDEAGRVYEGQQDVFLATGTMLPSGRAITHTGGGLEINSTANGHTGTATLTSGGTSYVLMRMVYDRSSRVAQTIQDNAAVTDSTYDGANRRLSETDPLGNVVEYEYDGNSNTTLITRTEQCTITTPTVDPEVFRSAMRYDSLNQPVVILQQAADGTFNQNIEVCCTWPVEPATIFSLSGYDSRGNQTVTIDPKANTAVTIYDGASRALQVVKHLRNHGEGDKPPIEGTFLPNGGATIVTTTIYDGNSRVTQLVDDRGGTTTYEYDTHDRQVEMIFHDGSTRLSAYDDASDVIQYTDENGSVFDNTYDAIGRRTACAITLASGVVGTTAQNWEYDGLSRMTFARDSISSTHADVNLRYDAVSRVLEDSQTYGGNTRDVTNTAFTSYPVTTFTFPNNRQTSNTYDDLYRRTLVEETSGGGDIASWQFFGPSRVAEVLLGNGLIQTCMNNDRTHSAVQESVPNPAWGSAGSDRLGYDGAGRMIAKRFLAGGIDGSGAYNDTTPVVGFTTAFDKSSNKFYERELHAESRSHLYQPFDSDGAVEGGYDSIDRLRQYQRGVLSSTGGSGGQGGGFVSTAITLPNTDCLRDYDLDGLGNWHTTDYMPIGGSTTTDLRQHNKLNEITTRKIGAAAKVTFEYDGVTGSSNGNLADDGVRLYAWDALNRLKEVRRKSDNALIGEYAYDARGFRMRKVISNGGLSGSIPDGTTDYIYNSGWQCVEERNGSNVVQKQYVWGVYIDELIQQNNVATIHSLSGDLYPLQDLLYRGTALTDDSGDIVEDYDTDAYGNTLIFNAAGASGDWWADDATQTDDSTNDYIFAGQCYNNEINSYLYRARYYLPQQGRFITRDIIEYLDSNNLYEYTKGRPIVSVDPTGMQGGMLGRNHPRTPGGECCLQWKPYWKHNMYRSPADCEKDIGSWSRILGLTATGAGVLTFLAKYGWSAEGGPLTAAAALGLGLGSNIAGWFTVPLICNGSVCTVKGHWSRKIVGSHTTDIFRHGRQCHYTTYEYEWECVM
ncbi:hypothetical protein HED60_13850 [Planctomycetales bacterium ZRK34]|nr:hypothetical protein HED60_13850 [Planctomycetales bacterium ZRK34]